MEGYIIRTIPEQKIKVCSGCEHYSRVLAVSGRNPVYKCDCVHPDVPLNISHEFLHGNILDDNTPLWCPAGARKVNQ